MKRIKNVRLTGIEGRDWRMRLFPVATARWLLCVKDVWPEKYDGQQPGRRALRKRAKELYRQRYGNPLLWFFLLEIVIKAIIWWLQSRKEQTP